MSGQGARQAYALAHPLNEATQSVLPYRATRQHRTGVLLMTVLAVDR